MVLDTYWPACMTPPSSQTSHNCLCPGKCISNGGFGEPVPLPMLLLPFAVWGLGLGKPPLWRFTGKLLYCLQEPWHPPGKSEAQTCNCFSGNEASVWAVMWDFSWFLDYDQFRHWCVRNKVSVGMPPVRSLAGGTTALCRRQGSFLESKHHL